MICFYLGIERQKATRKKYSKSALRFQEMCVCRLIWESTSRNWYIATFEHVCTCNIFAHIHTHRNTWRHWKSCTKFMLILKHFSIIIFSTVHSKFQSLKFAIFRFNWVYVCECVRSFARNTKLSNRIETAKSPTKTECVYTIWY